jgi:hypothetical protein
VGVLALLERVDGRAVHRIAMRLAQARSPLKTMFRVVACLSEENIIPVKSGEF